MTCKWIALINQLISTQKGNLSKLICVIYHDTKYRSFISFLFCLFAVLDAIGKPPGGILEGAITMFGNHKQCLDVRAPDDEDDFDEDEDLTGPRKVKEFFRGKYCALEIKPWLPPKPRFYGFSSKIESLRRDPTDDSLFAELSELAIFMHLAPLRFDLCVPSLCTREDLQRVSSFLGSKLDLKVKVSRCEVYSDSFTLPSTIQILAILAFMGAIGLISLCTTLMIFLPIVRKGHGTPLLVRCLSIQSSWKEWTGLESYEKRPRIATLYGLRWILLMWIIFTETINVINYNFFRDVLRLKDVIISQGAQIITNSSLQYSSLIFLSAFIFGYTNDNKGAWKGAKFVVKKYFRIMPVILAGIGIMMLLPMIQTPWIQGPTWADYVTNRTETCQSYWYRSLFFLQNFYHPTNVCLPHTWILCVELQLALVFTVIIGFISNLRSNGKQAASWIVLGFIAIVGFAINFAQVYYNQLPPTWLWTLPDRDQRYDYFFIHLYKPWTHLSVYAIGVASGILSSQQKRKSTQSNGNNNNNNLPSVSSSSPYGSCVVQFMGWSFISIVTGILIFWPHDWVLGNLPDPLISGFYDGFHRIAWAITHVILMLFVVKDIESESSILQFVLGNKIFLCFGRLSLAAFVVHPIILLLFFATQWTHLFSGLIVMLYFVIGTIALTYGLAFFVVMWFEYPASSLLNSRDSTAVEKDPRLLTQTPRSIKSTDDFSTFKSSIDKLGSNAYSLSTGGNGGASNGDMEMSKKQQRDHHTQKQQETAQIRL